MHSESPPAEHVTPDLWGEIVQAYARGEDAAYAIRRDDGYVDGMPSPAPYFDVRVSRQEEQALSHAHGHILDVGDHRTVCRWM